MGVSGSPPPKNGHFLPQKRPKNAKIGPTTLFFRLGRSQGSPALFCRCLTQKNIICMVCKPENRCFRAAPPQRWPFFGQKWPQIANLGKKTVFLDTGAQFKTPLPYFFECLTRKNICCIVLKPENGCIRAAPPKKWAFFAQKWPKNANIGPNTLFFGFGRSVQGPPNLFCRCLTQKKRQLHGMEPGNRCFRAVPPKRWPFFGQK